MATLEALRVAKAVFQWAVLHRRISIADHEGLVLSLLRQERRISGCGKVGFASFGIARRMAKIRRGKNGHRRRIAYRCDVCQLFHLGSAHYERDRRMLKGQRA